MTDYDVFLADCPARTTLRIFGGTWTPVVVFALAEHPHTHGELLSRIGGVSKKMLTQTLRHLQDLGLVEHSAAARTYALTPLGASLRDPVIAMVRWAEEHTHELAQSRPAPPGH